MSCFCSPLSTRSLGTRQHLSALCSLFHVTMSKKTWMAFHGGEEDAAVAGGAGLYHAREVICHTSPGAVPGSSGAWLVLGERFTNPSFLLAQK